MYKPGPKDWNPRLSIGADEIFEQLGEIAPSISFSVTWEEDHYFSWDGDGPDPRNEGYQPYNVDVYARAIVRGTMAEGRDSLGGSYKRPDEEDKDIHGYLPQMLDQALHDLSMFQLVFPGGLPKKLKNEIGSARQYLKDIMKKRYDRQGMQRGG